MDSKKKNAKKKKRKTAKAVPRVPKTPIAAISPEQQIVGATFLGKVKDFYAHVGVAALILEAPLALGDIIRVKGHTTDLTQKVEHMEVNHQSVQSAEAGEGVGVKIADRARAGDAVFKL